jgi:hypothetical protein
MKKDNRPVSYQQTLGTKTEIIKEHTEQKDQDQSTNASSLEKADANLPE